MLLLQNVSFEIRGGEIMAIMATTGTYKFQSILARKVLYFHYRILKMTRI